MPQTNEELCVMIQQGHEELTEQLWLQVVGFISMLAFRYLENYWPDKIDLKEDAVQESYFYFLQCIQKYDSNSGYKFTTYLIQYLKNPFRKVCFSGRGIRQENDLLNRATSLNESITDTDGNEAERGNLIADSEAETPFEAVDDESFWNSVNEYMQENFAKAHNERGKQIRIYMLRHHCEFMDALRQMFPEEAKRENFKNSGFAQACRRDVKKADRDFQRQWDADREYRKKMLALEDRATRCGLKQYGFASYTYGGSGVEQAVIKAMEKVDEQER